MNKVQQLYRMGAAVFNPTFNKGGVSKMKGKGYFFNVLCMIAIFVWSAFSLAACGGDGGGGTYAGISYTGPTTLVTIDTNNAIDIATEAYQGGSTGGMIGFNMGIAQNGENEYIGRSRSLVLSHALVKTLRQLEINSMSSSIASGTIHQESWTEEGTCGGSMSCSMSINDQTGDFSGSISYNNYCEEDTTLSGSIVISGMFDLGGEEFEPSQISMTFTVITVSTPSDSFTVSGSIDINFDVSLVGITMNMNMLEISTGKVYWFENYSMSVTEELDYIDVDVSGKFYEPDYGCVILSTSTPLRIYGDDEYPSEGVLIITGETGIGGGSTRARLTALSPTTYIVDADTNGDGTYDWSCPEPLYWSDL